MSRMGLALFLGGVLLTVDAQSSYGGDEGVHVDKPDKCECEAYEKLFEQADKQRKVVAMVEAREAPESPPLDPMITADPGFVEAGTMATRRRLTRVERDAFDRDGFVVLKGFFEPREVDLMRECLEGDGLVGSNNISILDATGRDTRLTLWWEFGKDTLGRMARTASLVNAVAELMGGPHGPPVEPFASHTKILLKEPHTGGAWEWHQDFGYWYAQGLTQPDKLISAIVAIDRNDKLNGAMRILTKSHRLGRLDHGLYGGQAGADPDRVLAAMKSPGHRVVTLELEPGDVAFTHSNLLHCSRPNDSDRWRRNVIAAFNGRGNEPPADLSPRMHPGYKKLLIEPDDAVLSGGCVHLDPGLDFLDNAASKESLENNVVLQ